MGSPIVFPPENEPEYPSVSLIHSTKRGTESKNCSYPPVSPPSTSPKIILPPSLTREKILSQDLDQHLHRLFENETEKQIFLQMMLNFFCYDTKIDLRQYQGPDFDPFGESKFLHPISSYKIPQLSGLRIAAVDGGLGCRNFLGIQMTLVKAAVVIYEFTQKSPTIRSFPESTQQGNYVFYTDLETTSDTHSTLLSGYRRTLAENMLLLQYLKKESSLPDIVLLDGSLSPPPFQSWTSKNGELQQYYEYCVQSYFDLYEFCDTHRIILAGSVKDSHSTILRDLLNRAFPRYLQLYPSLKPFYDIQYRQIFLRFGDTELLFKMLPHGQRTVAFEYANLSPFLCSGGVSISESSSKPKTSLSKSEFFGVPNSSCNPNTVTSIRNETPRAKSASPVIYAMYLQLSSWDIPLRIEFLSLPDPAEIHRKAESLSAILAPISSINPQCTLPLPQIEAHMRAHLPPEEFDMVTSQLERLFQTKNLQEWTSPTIESMKYKGQFPDPSQELKLKSYIATFMDKRHSRLPF